MEATLEACELSNYDQVCLSTDSGANIVKVAGYRYATRDVTQWNFVIFADK